MTCWYFILLFIILPNVAKFIEANKKSFIVIYEEKFHEEITSIQHNFINNNENKKKSIKNNSDEISTTTNNNNNNNNVIKFVKIHQNNTLHNISLLISERVENESVVFLFTGNFALLHSMIQSRQYYKTKVVKFGASFDDMVCFILSFYFNFREVFI